MMHDWAKAHIWTRGVWWFRYQVALSLLRLLLELWSSPIELRSYLMACWISDDAREIQRRRNEQALD